MFEKEFGLYYNRARYLDPTNGRFTGPDPGGYVDGMSRYESVGGNPVTRLDPTGRIPWTGHIMRIEFWLSQNNGKPSEYEKERAIAEATALVDQIIDLAEHYPGKKHSKEFFKRWRNKVGGTRMLSVDEMNDLLSMDSVKSNIGWCLNKKSPRGSGQSLFLKLNPPPTPQWPKRLRAGPNTDWFSALGYFELFFTGKWCVKGNKITLEGTFVLKDLYDWQNPGGKTVILAGMPVKNSYFTLVEDAGNARPFKVRGAVYRKDTYDLNAKFVGGPGAGGNLGSGGGGPGGSGGY